MSKRFLGGLAVVALIAGLYFLRPPKEHSARSGNGKPASSGMAPDFSLPGVNGERVRLSSYQGKVVLLDFWATWCGPCREEIPRFVAMQEKYRDQGLQVIGVSMDDSATPVVKFYRQFKMNYPVAMGNAQTGEAFGGILGLPIAFLVDRNGRIISKHVGALDMTALERELEARLRQTGNSL